MRADNGSVQAFAPSAFDLAVNILADYDGVIHDHPDHQQDSECGKDVPGNPEIGEEQNPARKSGDDSDRDP